VCDLQEIAPVAGNLMSYHLRVLREAGLVVATRRGRWVHYRLAPDAADRLHAALPFDTDPARRDEVSGVCCDD
jgi:ArsR family transcriptional regulator